MALIRTGGGASSSAIQHDTTTVNGRTTPATFNLTGNVSDIYIYSDATYTQITASVDGGNAVSFSGSPATAHITGSFTSPTVVITGNSDFGTKNVVIDAI